MKNTFLFLVLGFSSMSFFTSSADNSVDALPENKFVLIPVQNNPKQMDIANGEKIKVLNTDIIKRQSGPAMQDRITMLLDFLFGRNNDNLDIAEMEARTKELLDLDRSGYQKFNIWIKRLKQKADEAQKRYPKQEAICKGETREAEARKWYRVFRSYRCYWDAAQKVFPQEAYIKNTYTLVTNILDGLGTEEDLLKLVAENNQGKIKEARLPLARVKDAALEKLFMEAYDKMYSTSFQGKAIRAIVVSDDWQLQRNEVTGVVTGRLRKGAIVYKNKAGECRLIEEFFIQQEYAGNSFAGTKSVYAVGKGQVILCEFVK